MAVDERERNVLHTRLEQVLGGEEAATLMSYLPPVGWADVATKRDLDHLADRLRLELHEGLGSLRTALHEGLTSLRAELHQEVGGLRADLHKEVGGLRAELHEEVGGLRADLHEEVGGLRAELGALRDRIDDKLDANLRVLLFSMLGAVFTTAGLAFGAAQL